MDLEDSIESIHYKLYQDLLSTLEVKMDPPGLSLLFRTGDLLDFEFVLSNEIVNETS